MKTKLYLNAILAVAVAALIASCSGASKDKATQLAELKAQQTKLAADIRKLEDEVAKENPQATKARTKEVGVTEVKPGKFEYFIQTQGSIEAIDNIMLSAKSAGIISQVYSREGDVVKKGQTLAQIDNSLLTRNVDELKSSIDLATTVYNRQKNLWDQKIGTEVQYLQAKNNKENLEKRLATLNEQIDMFRIKSPIDGSVDEVDVKIGQNVAPGMPAFRVVSFDKLKMKANVSEAYVISVKKGDKVKLSFPDINKEFEAPVTFVGKTINQLSRTFPLEVALPTLPDLRPNMSGVLKVIFKTVPDAITVPVNVVQDVNHQKIVYIAEVDGNKQVARRKVVEVAGVYGNVAQVSGLKSGDKVITVGYQGLNDGELIKF
ncbi:MAG: efflux RND transporter periplasmic adaptor subunit [Cyclobacteriaceae bacterium]|nr:efflux RND transporter periplasmic adaptor subunit [Cyclobacteriaceae bacterium]